MSCSVDKFIHDNNGACPLSEEHQSLPQKYQCQYCTSDPDVKKCADAKWKAFVADPANQCDPYAAISSDVYEGLCASKAGPCEERYSPDDPVCNNQADYNQAFRNALKYNYKQNIKESKPWIWVYMAMYLIFFVWALTLASKVQPGPYRTMHMMLALLFAPVYVLAHYIGLLNK